MSVRSLSMLGAAVLLAACPSAKAPSRPGSGTVRPVAKPRPSLPAHQVFPDVGAAVAAILERSKPRIVAFGEVHQKTDSAAGVRSAVHRFGAHLGAFAGRVSDLIVETWVTKGTCGAEERRVVREVDKTTKRPPATENEILTVLRRAKKLGVEPHILELSCADYGQLAGKGKKAGTDYEKLLSLITRYLRSKATTVHRARAAGKAPTARAVAIYGGALHNDLFPHPDLAMFSFARALKKLTGGRYVEVDLYVPEFVEQDRDMREKPWFPLLRQTSPKHVISVERGPGSYVLLLRRTAAARRGGENKTGRRGRVVRSRRGRGE